jgi:hypothetical protein
MLPHPATLPAETWHLIVSHFVANWPHALLHNVAAVSRQLREIAEPLLYRSVVLSGNGSVRAFTHTIIARPVLAGHVKDMALEWKDQGDHDEMALNGERDEESHEKLQAVDGLQLSDQARPTTDFIRAAKSSGLESFWISMLRKENPTAEVVLMLHHLPALQSLHTTPPSSIAVFMEAFPSLDKPSQRTEAALPIALRNISSLSVGYWDTEGGHNEANVARFMLLPSLDRLTVSSIDGSYYTEDIHAAMPWLRGRSTLTELEFLGARIEAEILVDLLYLPKALKSFHYEHGSLLVGFTSTDLGIVADGLCGLEQLESLVFVDDSDNEGEVEDEQTWFSSLKSMSAIRRLELDVKALAEDTENMKLLDFLPPNLEDLTLRFELTKGAKGLADELLVPFVPAAPALKRLKLVPESVISSPIRRVCQSLGVELQG